ncbi:hypothetical protein [Synechococcus sp. PCC 7336]|uniref:hypothetical protein n=1 Tax=Synechococcus sp. PCC 7336 TaxID=195250 RepID=UPI000348F155|nr:hypothetical protein [Synechococcus sp. PCC 7336]
MTVKPSTAILLACAGIAMSAFGAFARGMSFEQQASRAESYVPATGSGSALLAHVDAQYGGQALESGDYFLEFVPEIEATTVHLDFFLETRDTHEAIPDAAVKVQVQLPDGSQAVLDMTYDAEGQHYTTVLDSTVAGEYRVAVLSDIQGQKVNGRFRFTR